MSELPLKFSTERLWFVDTLNKISKANDASNQSQKFGYSWLMKNFALAFCSIKTEKLQLKTFGCIERLFLFVFFVDT